MKLKKCIALALATVLTVSLAGCTAGSGTSWILKDDQGTVPAGVFIQYMMTAYSEAMEKLPDDVTGPLGQQIDGRPAEQWMEEQAVDLAKEHLAVERKFDELGLRFDEETRESIDTTIDYQWSVLGERYVLSGISHDSFAEAIENTYKANEIFMHYYGEGGELALSDEAYRTYFDDHYTRSTFIRYSKNPLDAMTAEERAAYDAELAAKAENPDPVEEGETPEEPLTQSGIEQAEAAQARLQAGEQFLTLITEVETEALAEGEELHSHEDPTIHDNLISDLDESVPAAYRTAVAEMAEGEVRIVEDGNYYYLIEKLPLAEDAYVDMKNVLLSEMKSDEFAATISDWADALTVEVNEKAVERYGSNNFTK